jgi:hypothetical protein
MKSRDVASTSLPMPTDAKCGLLVGVGVVLAVAVLFFQKDPPAGPAPAPVQARSPAAAVKPPTAEPVRPRDSSPAPGRPVSRTAEDDPLDFQRP